MRVSTSSFFPQIEPKVFKALNRGLTQDENSFTKQKSQKVIQAPDTNGQPLKNRQNTISIDTKKRNSILLGNNQKEIIKSLSDKLDDHQYQIDSRNNVIEELERQVSLIRTELQNEKVALQVKTEQNTKLSEHNDKLNNRIRQQTQKFDDLQTKFVSLEQEIKNVKEQEKTRTEQWNMKETNYQKKISELEGKLNAQISENKAKAKSTLNDCQKQITDLQAQIKSLEINLEKVKNDYNSQEYKIKALEKDKLSYCSEALELRQKCAYYKEKIENEVSDSISNRDQLKQKSQECESLKKQMIEIQHTQAQLGDIKQQTDRALSDYEKKIQTQIEFIKRLEIDIEGFKKQEKERIDEIKTLKLYVDKKDQSIASLTDQIQSEKQQKGSVQKDKEIVQKEIEGLKDQISLLNQNVNLIKTKEQIFKVNVDKLDKGEQINFILKMYTMQQQELLKSLKCNHCQKFIKEPITIIPCGHSFCYQCKKAYAKDCIKCGSKVKVEAMYRNELLDDIIAMYKTINGVKESLLGLIKIK